MDVKRARKCDECGGTSFMEDWHCGDTICKNCGWVMPERLVDLGEEKRNFSANHTTLGWNSNNRSAALDAYTGAMSTTIIGEGAGKLLQLQNQHQGQGAYKEKQVQDGVNSIATVCGLYNLRLSSRVKHAASKLWVEFEHNRKKYSRTADLSMHTAVIYEACKQEGQHRSYSELAKAVKVDVKAVHKCHKRLVKVLKENLSGRPEPGRGTATGVHHPQWAATPRVPSPATPGTPVASAGVPQAAAAVPSAAAAGRPSNSSTPTSTTVTELMTRACDTLRLEQRFIRKATQLVPLAAGHLEGRRPVTIAAACILFVAKHFPDDLKAPLSDKKIAQIAQVAAGTMRTAYKKLAQHMDELVGAIAS